MLKRSNRFINHWEKVRQRGKIKYVMNTGMIMGLSLMVGATISRLLYYQPFIKYYWHDYFVYFIRGFFGGILVALVIWNIKEEKYKRLINN